MVTIKKTQFRSFGRNTQLKNAKKLSFGLKTQFKNAKTQFFIKIKGVNSVTSVQKRHVILIVLVRKSWSYSLTFVEVKDSREEDEEKNGGNTGS